MIGRRKDKKDKSKDRGYAALEGESSPEEEMDAKYTFLMFFDKKLNNNNITTIFLEALPSQKNQRPLNLHPLSQKINVKSLVIKKNSIRMLMRKK